MKNFVVNKWEVDEVGDELNKKLFTQGSKKLRKNHNSKFDGTKPKKNGTEMKKIVGKNASVSHKNTGEKNSTKRPHKVLNLEDINEAKKSKISPKCIQKPHNENTGKNIKNVTPKQSKILSVKKSQLRKKTRNDEFVKNAKTSHKVGEKLNIKRIQEMLLNKKRETGKSVKEPAPLKDRMMSRLRASRFRYLNETLYNNQSFESRKMFKEDPDAFEAYHTGYRQQVERWPLNPLDTIISAVKKMPKDYVIADFGCGEARLASSVEHKVNSLDLVALNDKVTACDMAHSPLLSSGVHVVVFCLSLMGGNLSDYILEANRVLKKDGILKIADIESRFENIDEFIRSLGDYGFKNTWKDLSHNLFYFMDFKKVSDVDKRSKKLPTLSLKSCLYKRR